MTNDARSGNWKRDSSPDADGQAAYLSMGSNLGDRKGHLEKGLLLLDRAGISPRRVSSIFETEPVGDRDQPWFLNLTLEASTDMTPNDLLRCCLEIEKAQGRIRSFRGAPRTLDLDILLYGDLILQDPHLIIPHPRMVDRKFVLQPLAEIAPAVIHPVLKRSILSLLLSCPDLSKIQLYSQGGPA